MARAPQQQQQQHEPRTKRRWRRRARWRCTPKPRAGRLYHPSSLRECVRLWWQAPCVHLLDVGGSCEASKFGVPNLDLTQWRAVYACVCGDACKQCASQLSYSCQESNLDLNIPKQNWFCIYNNTCKLSSCLGHNMHEIALFSSLLRAIMRSWWEGHIWCAASYGLRTTADVSFAGSSTVHIAIRIGSLFLVSNMLLFPVTHCFFKVKPPQKNEKKTQPALLDEDPVFMAWGSRNILARTCMWRFKPWASSLLLGFVVMYGVLF